MYTEFETLIEVRKAIGAAQRFFKAQEKGHCLRSCQCVCCWGYRQLDEVYARLREHEAAANYLAKEKP